MHFIRFISDIVFEVYLVVNETVSSSDSGQQVADGGFPMEEEADSQANGPAYD